MKIEPARYYSLREAAEFLEVTEATVAKYLREGGLQGKKIGPKQKWHALGQSIIRLRREWGYEKTEEGNFYISRSRSVGA